VAGALLFSGYGAVDAEKAPAPVAQTPSVKLVPSTPGYGCSFWPYIQCSASWVITQTTPERIDYDITFTYYDNRTDMGSTFGINLPLHIVDDAGNPVYNTDVPIWWVMYPVTNEVMPTRRVHVQFPTNPQYLDPMSSPSGLWIVPSQPYNYNTFWIEFERPTTVSETLVRTDTWHFAIATAPGVVCYGSSCDGLYAIPMGCDENVYNTKPIKRPNNNQVFGQIQILDSYKCLAQWEKTINGSGSPMYAEGSIRWGESNYTSGKHPINSPTPIDDGDYVYTPMYGRDEGMGPSLSCGNVSTSGPIYPPTVVKPLSIYNSYNCLAR
jgi:hypothetical protein